jgi:hypothetical protein
MQRALAATLLGSSRLTLLAGRKPLQHEEDWICEIKFDGYRALARTEPDDKPGPRNSLGSRCAAPERFKR